MKSTIAIAGALAQRPVQGGHTWVFLQYLLGFKRLGHDVLFLDSLGPGMARDAAGQPTGVSDSFNHIYLNEVMTRFGMSDSWALLDESNGHCLGLSRELALQKLRDAVLINVMGYLRDAEFLATARRRVFLDIDPGFPQMWHQLGLADLLTGHDDFVTVGENIGRPDCTIPTCGRTWLNFPQPVVLEQWPITADSSMAFTSVATWRGNYGPIEYNGQRYGLRLHEFRKFLPLPKRTGREFRIALDIHPGDAKDKQSLLENRWQLDDPAATKDPWAYRGYIQASGAEYTVAKNMYVQSRGGWFSDRSIAYLASGKPVLAQDTGFAYGGDVGLLKYRTLDEAIAGVESITADPKRHERAARAIAETHFDSDHVLRRWLNALAIG